MTRFKQFYFSSVVWLVLMVAGGLALWSISGCSSAKIADTEIDVSFSESSTEATSTRVIRATNSDDATSPAQLANQQIDETDPLQVCQQFMELLQIGNQIGAENFLTKRALAVTGRAELALEPISDLNAGFELSQPKFNSLKNEIAYIDCQVENSQKPGSPVSMTWILKKQSSNHWRISGVMLPDEGMSMPRMVSFENPTDVQWMQEAD